MKAKNILSSALAMIFDNTTEYDGYAVPLFNTMIPELFVTENIIRRTEGKELLEEIPYISKLEDDIPYQDSLTMGAMPFSLAAFIVLDDNDYSKSSYFRQLYTNAVNQALKTEPEAVVDIYA